MPVPTTRLADVVTGDPQPLVLGGRRQHALQAARGCGSPARLSSRAPGAPSAIRSASASRTCSNSSRPATRGSAKLAGNRCRCRRAEKPRPQGGTSSCSRRAIWRRSSARARRSSPPTRSAAERLSIEQIRHKTESSVDHRPTAENEKLVKESCLGARLSGDRGAGDPERLVDGGLGHALDLHGDDRDAPGRGSDRRPIGGGGAEEQLQGPARRRSSASPGPARLACRAATRRGPSRGCKGARRAASASKARRATPVSTVAIVSASAGMPRLTKAPSWSRSRASCSTGVRVRSGSRPIWRKKTR